MTAEVPRGEVHESPSTATTEIAVDGANCAYCMGTTLDRLREEPGVLGAHSSMTGQCLVVEHEQLPVAQLLDLIRRHLHGVAQSSVERVMVTLDPQVADLHWTHQ